MQRQHLVCFIDISVYRATSRRLCTPLVCVCVCACVCVCVCVFAGGCVLKKWHACSSVLAVDEKRKLIQEKWKNYQCSRMQWLLLCFLFLSFFFFTPYSEVNKRDKTLKFNITNNSLKETDFSLSQIYFIDLKQGNSLVTAVGYSVTCSQLERYMCVEIIPTLCNINTV